MVGEVGARQKKKLFKKVTSKIFRQFLDILYPKNCLHCRKIIEEEKFFCNNCLSFFSLARVDPFSKYCYLFENEGPAISFFREVKNTKLLSLLKVGASYVFLQKSNMNWDKIDVITTLDFNFLKKDYKYFLSKEVSKMLKIKFCANPKHFENILVIDDLIDEEKYRKYFDKPGLQKIYVIAFLGRRIK